MKDITIALREKPTATIRHIAKLYRDSGCEITSTALALGITRQYLYQLISRSSDLKRALKRARTDAANRALTE